MKSYYITTLILVILSIILALFVYTEILDSYLSFLPFIPILIAVVQGLLNYYSQRYQEIIVEEQNEVLEDISESIDKKFEELDTFLEQKELLTKFETRQKIIAKLIDKSLIQQETIYKIMMPRELSS